jgi:hypothetical protein
MALIKLNNRSIKDVTSLPFGVGTLIHIQSQTASNSASISFTGINGTYKEYQFYFIDIHARIDNTLYFGFNLSTDNGSNYNVTKTTTVFDPYNFENNAASGIQYSADWDLAQSTDYQLLIRDAGNDADQTGAGSMSLFNPSSTTYVKHFIATTNFCRQDDISFNAFIAGYANTTSAINAIRFQMSGGNFDGTIAMFGVL